MLSGLRARRSEGTSARERKVPRRPPIAIKIGFDNHVLDALIGPANAARVERLRSARGSPRSCTRGPGR
jgi:hypothetical protein